MKILQSPKADSGLVDLGHVGVTTLSGILRKARWRLSLPHSDPHPVMIWILKGHSRVTAAGETKGLGPASAVFLPAHSAWSIDPGPSLQAQLVRLPKSAMAPFPDTPTVVRVRRIEDQKDLSAIIDAIGRCETTPLGRREQLAHSILLSAWLGKHMDAAPTKRPAKALRVAAAFTEAVEETLGSGKNLADLGAVMGLTPTHLTRSMKATCGMTAAQYLTDRTMHEARRLLVDSPRSAAQIARDLGYSSPAYFSRAFLAHAGVPPGAFRAARQAEPAPLSA